MAKAYIGTSGWNYKDWKGKFYPEGLKQKEWLSHLAGQFDTTEINSSFYRIPKPEAMRNWQEKTPQRFRFAVKIWRGITHYKKLVNCEEVLHNFFEVANELETQRRAPVLVQLPPNQNKDLEKLDNFLTQLKKVTGRGWKVTVEFRNEQWLCEEVYDVLDKQRAALCLHDMEGRAPVSRPNDASFVYIRRHGPSDAQYRGRYSAGDIRKDARKVSGWLREGKTVFVYYNNDLGGHAVDNAAQLKQALNL